MARVGPTPTQLERQNRRSRRQSRYGPGFNLNAATPEQLYALESEDVGSDLLPDQDKRRRLALVALALRQGGTALPEGWTPETVHQAFPGQSFTPPPAAPGTSLPAEVAKRRKPKRDLYIGNTGRKRPVKLPGKPSSAPNVGSRGIY